MSAANGTGGHPGLDAESEAHAFRALFEYAPIGIAAVDLQGHVFAANQALAQLLGFSESSLRGRAVTDLTHPDDLLLTDKLFSELAAAKRASYSVEKRYLRADGEAVKVHATAILVRGHEGDPRFALGLVEPLDELARLQETVGDARAAAHDFNNLLTAIVGYAELLLSELEPDKPGRSDAEQIREAARMSVSLVRHLLADSRARTPHPESLDVNDLILRLRDVAKQLVGSGTKIVVRLDPSKPRAFADREGLERAIANVASNARDAMPEGGTFTIETKGETGAVKISMSDTGSGIEPDLQERIFERDFSTKARGVGHGIGLANVRDFAEGSGGSVEVDSAPGQGSTFTVTLPSDQPTADA